MCYLYIKEAKVIKMTAKKKQTKPFFYREERDIRKIIKYDTSRKYFGSWTPRELNKSYQNAPCNLKIGILSVDDICDALWHEMSYNPVRFGYKSPFVFNGKNSLKEFIDSSLDLANNGFETLSVIQTYLSRFWRFATKLYPDFEEKGYAKNNSVWISTVLPTNPNSNPVPNNAYLMLDLLRKSLKEITKRNLADFYRVKYRDMIAKVVMARHEQTDTNERKSEPISILSRPIKIADYAETQRKSAEELFISAYEDTDNFAEIEIVGDKEKLPEYRKNKKLLEKEFVIKDDEILETESRIEELNSFEEPGDISEEQSKLRQLKETKEEIIKSLERVNALIQSAKHPQKPRS